MQRFPLLAKLFFSLAVLLLISSCGLEIADPGGSTGINTGIDTGLDAGLGTDDESDSHSHQVAGTGVAATPTTLESLVATGDLSIAPIQGIGSLSGPTAPLQMRLLIISASRDDSSLGAAEALMKQVGVPYDLLIASEQTLTEDLLTDGTTGNYQGIILTTSGLPYEENGVFTSAFTPTEWQTLWSYESEFAIRQLTLYTFPSVFPEDYGIAGIDTDGDGFANGNGNETTITLTTEGQAIFTSLKNDATMPVKHAYMYPSLLDATGGVTATPILQDSSGNILGVTSTSLDGRERMALTMGHNQYLLHTQLLGYDMLRWLTHGVFIGERRMYLSIDIDDWYLESDVWNPATLSNWAYEEQVFRLRASDVYAARDGVLDIRERFNAPTFNYIQIYNALKGDPNAIVNCKDNASLSDASLCLGTFFDWVSHTFSHANMTNLSYDEARAELEQNIIFGESQPIDVDKKFLVTGRHSGLGWKLISEGNGQSCEVDQVTSDEYCQFGLDASNPEMLRAVSDLGIEYLAANRGWVTHTHKDGCDTCLLPHPMNTNIKLIPRWPTNIYYNTTTPVENASEFNYLYGPNGIIKDGNGNTFYNTNQTWTEVLEFESEITMRHILSFSPYPHFFHQDNLKEYAPGRNLIYDWAEATLIEYSKYFDTPIISQDWEGITTTLSNRTSFFNALQANAISGTWDRVNNSVSISTNQSATVYVTGADISGGSKWTYGPDRVSQKYLGAGSTITASVTTAQTNTTPTLSSINNQSGVEGETASLAISFRNTDQDYLGFSASNLPPGLAIDPATGRIAGIFACETSGNYNVTVKVTDGQFTAQQSFSWTVAAAAGSVGCTTPEVTAPVGTTIFEADFEASMDDFAYSDDLFRNTNQPNYVNGERDIAGDYVSVNIGNTSNNNNINNISGGFTRSFNLSTSGTATVTLKYRINQATNYEEDEYVQALLSVDGQLYGTNGLDNIAQTAGGADTGWQTAVISIGTLSAGNHTLSIGGFNNKRTYSTEVATVSFDDVVLTLN